MLGEYKKMKLGLYGGGFKPFTTGHFSKLANAIRDNDNVYLFYGIQERKPPKIGKSGRPLKSTQKFRGLGDTGRFYTPELSKDVFDIYERAIEREFPSVEVESTIGTTPMRRIFEILEEFDASPDMYDRVTVYGDIDTMRIYLRELRRYENLVRMGKIQLGGAIPESIDDYLDSDRLKELMRRSESIAAHALARYYDPDFNPDADEIPDEILRMARVRGEEVRRFASAASSSDEAKRFLPPFLNDDEKQNVIDMLLGKQIDSLRESDLRYFIRGMIRG